MEELVVVEVLLTDCPDWMEGVGAGLAGGELDDEVLLLVGCCWRKWESWC